MTRQPWADLRESAVSRGNSAETLWCKHTLSNSQISVIEE